MSDPVAAVTETEAGGENAAIFADIRAVYGVSVVNLIWRHLATFPGALPWAWGTVRPLYVDGTIAREAAGLRAARRLPGLARVPAEVFAALGLARDDLHRIGIVLDAYERTNPMALIALSVVEQRLSGAPAPAPAAEAGTPVAGKPEPEPELKLPPLLRPDQMAPATEKLMLRLNRIGTVRPDPVLASMYRTLAHWPGYLALAWALLAPLEGDGLAEAIAGTRALAQSRAQAIAARGLTPAALPSGQHAAVAEALARFTGDAIGRMVVICGMLRRAGLGA